MGSVQLEAIDMTMAKFLTFENDNKINTPKAAPNQVLSGFARRALFAFGCLNVALGLIGAILPVMPTTVFLIAATWAFSKSSTRFHFWIWNHPLFGPSVRAWYENRAIPFRAKVAAITMMSASFLYVTLAVAESWVLPLIMAGALVPAAIFIASRANASTNKCTLTQSSQVDIS